MRNATTLLRLYGALLAAVFQVLTSGGCDMQMGALRWAPSEQQKQSAQIGADLTTGLAATGARPESPAAIRAARAARAAATYTGPPDQPVNVEDLLLPERRAWPILEARAAAWKLKEKLQSRAGRVAGAALTELSESVQDAPQVAADAVIHRVRAIVDLWRMTEDVASEIDLPRERPLSAAEQARLDELKKLTDRVTAAADAQGARRPTAGEVSEQLREQVGKVQTEAEKWIATVKDSAPWALSALGLGGGAYALKKRKDAKAAAAERNQAVHDQQTQNRDNTMLLHTLADKLTAQPPPGTSPTPMPIAQADPSATQPPAADEAGPSGTS